MQESEFRAQLKEGGYDEARLIEWSPDTFNDTHTHEFDASVLVLAGEITVTTADETCTCRAGDTFSLNAGIPHKEMIGPEGVKFLSGRRQA